MKNILIAAAMAGMMLGAAPAAASPAPAPGITTPQDMRNVSPDDRRMDRRDDRRMDRRDDRRDDRADRRMDRRDDRGWRGNGRHRGWSSNRWCHNVRRHHRWVRVCGRR